MKIRNPFKKTPPKKMKDQGLFAATFSNNAFGNLTAGGIQNTQTGMGSISDKTNNSFFLPTRTSTRTELETVYNESWAAKKFIDIPIDDMFIRGRKFVDMDEKAVEAIKEQEKIFKANSRLARVMKTGRLYGTGLLVFMTKEAPLDKPFNINRMRPGDLTNLLVIDRFDCSVLSRNADPFSKRYGSADMYQVNIKHGGAFHVHASRVVRFDGLEPLSMTGWYNYDQDWGVSEIIPVITSILQDGQLASGIAHLMQEASIPVMKIQDFEDAITSNCDAEMSLAQRAELVSLHKSIYRTTFMDANDEFERNEVNFSQLPDLMDRFASRLAAAADIPATRFWGQSPVGMNATGESDMMNYATHVAARQQKVLPDAYDAIDKVLMRNAGVEAEVNYEFESLIDLSERDQAEVLEKKSRSVLALTQGAIIDENEGRAIIDGDHIAGNLEEREDLFSVEEFLKKQSLNTIGEPGGKKPNAG